MAGRHLTPLLSGPTERAQRRHSFRNEGGLRETFPSKCDRVVKPRMTGAEMRRTVRRLTAGAAASALAAAVVVTGSLMYSADRTAAVADSTSSSDVPSAPSSGDAESDVESDVESDAVSPDDSSDRIGGNAEAPTAPLQPPTATRGGGHASSGGS